MTRKFAIKPTQKVTIAFLSVIHLPSAHILLFCRVVGDADVTIVVLLLLLYVYRTILGKFS